MAPDFTHPPSRKNLLGERPDTALVALLSNERHVTARTPPAFLVHTRADPTVPFRNSEAYAEALRKAGVPGELRAYDYGSHAFVLGRKSGPGSVPVPGQPSDWTDHCARWLSQRGFLAAPRHGRGPRRSP